MGCLIISSYYNGCFYTFIDPRPFPLHLQGVQLYIEILDSDSSGGDDLIDVLLIDHDLPVGQSSSRQIHSGIFDFMFVIMDLSITARCLENFQGPNCSQCLPGFTGAMCNVSINDCIGVNCSGNGQCVDGVLSFTCDCDPGFTGQECEVSIDDCAGTDCNGNGVCVVGVNSFICRCNSGFTGDLCQTNIDDCVGVNCSGNGVCLDGVNSFTCQCIPGFGGTICNEFEGICYLMIKRAGMHLNFVLILKFLQRSAAVLSLCI